MSVATEITRIQTARDEIRVKLTELGLCDETAKIDDLATAVEGIENRGAIEATVTEGSTYTIPKGYHNGSGTVTGLSDTQGDAEKYKTQTKTVTPTKAEQNVTPDGGYYALSSVTVGAIPAAFQNVSSVTATAADVLTGKKIVTADGTVTVGTMPNNEATAETLDTETTSYTIPKGYHDGTGKVSITVESKEVTPTKSAQSITPTTGSLLGSVEVAAIPDEYITTTDATAKDVEILAGKTAYVGGKKVTGAMANNGAIAKSLDGLTATSVTIPAGYTTGGTVSLTGDIEEALAAI